MNDKLKSKRDLFRCPKCHEKNNNDRHMENEMKNIMQKLKNNSVNAIENNDSALVNILTTIKKLTGDKNIIPNRKADMNSPTFFYADSSDFEEAIDSIMDSLDSFALNPNSLSNEKTISNIEAIMSKINDYITNEDGNYLNNKNNNLYKTKLMSLLKNRYNLINHKLLASDLVDDKFKEKIQSLTNIPSIVEFPNNDEKNAEREINVLINIKNIIGEDNLSLITKDNKFTSEIDPSSISEGSTNYVEALNNLANNVLTNFKVAMADKDTITNTMNTLYKAIISRNALSSDHKVTLALNKLYRNLYVMLSYDNKDINKPLNLKHLEQSEIDDNDSSNSKLIIPSSQSNEDLDDVFEFVNNGEGKNEDNNNENDDNNNENNKISYAHDNINLITNTLEKKLKNSVENNNEEDLEFVNSQMSKIKTKLSSLMKHIKNLDGKSIKKSLKKVASYTNLFSTLKQIDSKFNEYELKNPNKINEDDDMNIYNPNSKAYKIVCTELNRRMLSILKNIKSFTGNNDILPHDGKKDSSKNPSFENLDNYEYSLEAKERLNREDVQDMLDAADKVMKIMKITYYVINYNPPMFIMKNIIGKGISKLLKCFVTKVKSTNPLDRTPENHALIKKLSANSEHSIDISGTESYNDIVYDAFVKTLRLIKEKTNDENINLDALNDDTNTIDFSKLVKYNGVYASSDPMRNASEYIRNKIKTLDEADSLEVQKFINHNIQKLSSMVHQSSDNSSKNDINISSNTLKCLNDALPNDNEKKTSNNKLIKYIKAKNEQNTRTNDHLSTKISKPGYSNNNNNSGGNNRTTKTTKKTTKKATKGKRSIKTML